MSLKTTVKYIQSGESSSPTTNISNVDLALGNISSAANNMLPSTGSLNNLITSPLELNGGALGGNIDVVGSLGGIVSVDNLSSIGGNIDDIIGSTPVSSIGNGVLSNASSITESIAGSLTGAINGSIGSIGDTITNNVNAISGAINGLKQDISDTVSSFTNVASAVASGDIGKLVNSVLPSLSFNTKPSTDWGLCYPETLKNVALNPAHIHFQFFKQNTKTKLTSIHLPMPDEIKNPSTINWEATDFGMMGTAAVKAVKSVKSDSVDKGALKDELNSMAERVKSVAAYHVASEMIEGLGGNKGMSPDDLMGAASGKMTNPYKTFLFRGVNFRTFNFKFSLVPFSESDCTLIDKIVSKFREHSYPDFAVDKMFFTYPDECQITYMWESNHNKWLNNFKRAVCSGIDADFAPLGQWASLRNGFPYMIQLSTVWTEVEIITKSDINKRDSQGQRG